MIARVYKYKLAQLFDQTIMLPVDAEILTVQGQNAQQGVMLWAKVDVNTPKEEPRRIVIFGTGHDIPDGDADIFINTFMIDDGLFVFHAFERLVE